MFSLTVSKLALLQHLTKALTECQVALALGTFDELFQFIGTGLLLLRVLLVHWLGLVRLLRTISDISFVWDISKKVHVTYNYRLSPNKYRFS